ncbi:MAG: 8-amino-7-oxononanoate synthase [Bacteroidota bacterium]
MEIFSRLAQQLAERKAQGNYRQLNGQLAGIDFCSNDYLGLARTTPAIQLVGHGGSGARLISGDRLEYHALEEQIATFHGAEAALVFPSGYAANTGLLSCLPQRADTILYDALIHASLRDGIRLATARSYSFRHNDLAHLAERLERCTGPAIVVTESIFSMDGDQAPLQNLADLCQTHQALLIVDEAHAVGIHGKLGTGLVSELGLTEQIPLRVVTFGKALGAHGAAVLGPQSLKDYLVNFCRPFIYSTAPGPAFWQLIEMAYTRMAQEQATRLQQLRTNIAYFREQMPAHWQEQLLPAYGPIQLLLVPGAKAVVKLEQALSVAGIAVKAIRSPTVAAGQERLRICLHAFNKQAEIDQLFSVLETQRSGR